MAESRTIWFDFDNTPHVQYLFPLTELLRDKGYSILFTARDYSQTVPLLSSKQVIFKIIGRGFGSSKAGKILGTLSRTGGLFRHVIKHQPLAAFSSSRACSFTAFLLGIPSFVFCDYEHVELSSYQWMGAFLVVPDVIPKQVFTEKGFSPEKIISFPGLKEDISLYGIDFDLFQPLLQSDLVTAVLRPPAEEGHYFFKESLNITRATLDYLSRRQDVLVVFSPRYAYQVDLLNQYTWINRPVRLVKPAPFISLMKSADLVISSGGTMLREAAVLGVSAYSILANRQGAVDQYLHSKGVLEFISGPQDVIQKLRLEKRNSQIQYQKKTETIDFVIQETLSRIKQGKIN